MNQWDVLIKTVELLVLPFCVYVLRTLSILQAEVRSVKEALIGIDGKNGIRSRVERIERRFYHETDD